MLGSISCSRGTSFGWYGHHNFSGVLGKLALGWGNSSTPFSSCHWRIKCVIIPSQGSNFYIFHDVQYSCECTTPSSTNRASSVILAVSDTYPVGILADVMTHSWFCDCREPTAVTRPRSARASAWPAVGRSPTVCQRGSATGFEYHGEKRGGFWRGLGHAAQPLGHPCLCDPSAPGACMKLITP